MAVDPDTTGVGSAEGHVSDIQYPPVRSVASTVPPPPDKASPLAAASGDHVPSLPRTSDASAAAHDDPRRTQRGAADTTDVNDPSGSANVCETSVRSATISVRMPLRRAVRSAPAVAACRVPVPACAAGTDFGAATREPAAAARLGAAAADCTATPCSPATSKATAIAAASHHRAARKPITLTTVDSPSAVTDVEPQCCNRPIAEN